MPGHANPTGLDRPKGRVSKIQGSVVDVRFPRGALPPINTALEVPRDGGRRLTLEVQQHRDPETVRCVAIHETAGLACGAEVTNSGSPILFPVGDAVLGRLLNVVGETIDHGRATDRGTPPARRSTAVRRRFRRRRQAASFS
jgi:F-type H+-transporting ATPase subunit beta